MKKTEDLSALEAQLSSTDPKDTSTRSILRTQINQLKRTLQDLQRQQKQAQSEGIALKVQLRQNEAELVKAQVELKSSTTGSKSYARESAIVNAETSNPRLSGPSVGRKAKELTDTIGRHTTRIESLKAEMATDPRKRADCERQIATLEKEIIRIGSQRDGLVIAK